jgi:hypothetical protein
MIAFDKEDNEIFAFGKHKGVKVDKILETEPGVLVGYKMPKRPFMFKYKKIVSLSL